MMTLKRAILIAALLFAACGSSPPTSEPSTVALDGHFAAPHETNGPIVMVQPRLVSVAFASDPDRETQRDFVAFLCHSDWWASWAVGTCGEADPASCVGLCAGATDVVLDMPVEPTFTTPPKSKYYDPAPPLDGLLLNAFAAHLLPEPSANDLYILHLPAETKVHSGGDDVCKWYTDDVIVRHVVQVQRADQTMVDVQYVVVVTCGDKSDWVQRKDALTRELSQRVALATKRPTTTDDQTESVVSTGSDATSLCTTYARGEEFASEGGYVLAKVWSNGESAAGHEPCAPATVTLPYVEMRAEHQTFEAPLAVNENAAMVVIPLLAVSDKPVPEGWLVSAVERVDLTDQTSLSAVARINGEPSQIVHAGDVVELRVTLAAHGPQAKSQAPSPRLIAVYSTRLTTQATNVTYLYVVM